MMQRITYIIFLVAAQVPASSAIDTGRGLRGHQHGGLEAKSVSAANVTQVSFQAKSVSASNGSLQALGDSCRCSFKGTCSCVQALEFMQCIQDACDSGACDCSYYHYFRACKSFSSECPSADLTCTAKEASCPNVPPMVTESSMELVGDIQVMQERRCRLKQAVADGYMNGKPRIAELSPKIQDRSDELKKKGIAVPTLGCSEEDDERFQQFKAGLQAQMDREKVESEAKVSKADAKAKKDEQEHEEEEEEPKAKEDEQEEEEDEPKAKTDEQEAGGKNPEDEDVWERRKRLGHLDEDTDKEHAEALEEQKENLQEYRKNLAGAVPNLDHGQLEVDSGWAVPRGGRPDKDMLRLIWWARPKHWLNVLVAVFINILLAFICAWIYNRYRWNPRLLVLPKPVVIVTRDQSICTCGNNFLPDSVFCRHCGTKRPAEDDLGIGLFSCFSDMKLTLFTCCCPCLRWADTMDKTGLQSYWAAFATFLILAALAPYTFGITGLLLVVLCVRQRQRLRRKYNVAQNNGEDCAAYLFCGTCAVVQEARVQVNLGKSSGYNNERADSPR